MEHDITIDDVDDSVRGLQINCRLHKGKRDLMVTLAGITRYYAVLRNTVVIPAIFGSKFEGAACRMASKKLDQRVERHKNVLETLGLWV